MQAPLFALQLFYCFILNYLLLCCFILDKTLLLALQLLCYLVLSHLLYYYLILYLFCYLILCLLCCLFLYLLCCFILFLLCYLILYLLCYLLSTLATKLPFCTSIFYLETLIILSSHFLLDTTITHLLSSVFRIFKQILSNECLRYRLTSSIKPLCFISTLNLLQKRSKYKQFFDTIFTNSRLLTGNHIAKEVHLSFGKSECPIQVKLNQLWQLELLDQKPVCIIEANLLTAILFQDLLFISCLRQTMKLLSKPEFRIQGMINRIVKKSIELVWVNKIIC